ncbi:hypothetical protein V5279_16805 [Bradyrhizobium sp. 26S5]|uniref:hypothetical protein n=1 Tax=Bradyrhizobium sp. 26S5 TaxID=3139729 RepID=UPI0030CCBFB2
MQIEVTEENQPDDNQATPSSSEQNLQSTGRGTTEDRDLVSQGDSRLADPDEGWDDTDYTPDFIEDLLDDPPILPNEDKDKFNQLFESFEQNQQRPKTDFEYLLTFQATIAAWELMRYEGLKIAIIAKERPGAVKALYRRYAVDKVAQSEVDQSTLSARNDAMRHFVDPEYQKVFMQKLECDGFGRSAVDAEAFGRALNSLSAIDLLIQSAEKRLADCLKRLEEAYRGRDPEQPMPRSMAARRADDRRRKRYGLC